MTSSSGKPRRTGEAIGGEGYTKLIPLRGRSTAHNPPNRFETREYIPDGEAYDPDEPGPRTQLISDASRTIIATNDSPDISFDASINPYRGCEHGCSYCFARPTHEYLGYSAGLDFETKILVKRDAPALLRKELASRKWQPKVLIMSGVTDPYQPVEAKLGITRGCLEVLAEARNPVAIITKNHRVTRDIDLLRELAEVGAVRVNLSVTTLDPELQRSMEPRTSTPARRLKAIEALAAAGIPVNAMVAPVVPGLTDHEMPKILQAVADAGASGAGFVTLRLPHAVAPLFQQWLERDHPERAGRVLARLREMHGGRLYQSKWRTRMRGEGVYADHIATLFRTTVRRLGLDRPQAPLRTDAFRRPAPPPAPPGPQLGLFEEAG